MHHAEKTLREHIKAGRGQGHGARYQPWLQISRRKMPSNGNINYRHLPMLGRYGHFLSRNESNIAIWLLWLGAEDLREQYPLWPFSYPHPLYGRSDTVDLQLPWSRGTLAIAKDLGIEHGRMIGTAIPYVASTDFMLTITGGDCPKAIAIAAKPSDLVEGKVKAKQRVKERLALEMAYARELGIPWLLMSDGEIGRPLRENLELILPCAQMPDEIASFGFADDYFDWLSEALRTGMPVGVARQMAAYRWKLTETAGYGLFYHGLWRRRLPIDLREPIVMSRPARLTDFQWANAAAECIFGGGDHA